MPIHTRVPRDLNDPADEPLDRTRLAEVLRGSPLSPQAFLAEFRRSFDVDVLLLLEAFRARDCAQVEQLAHRIEGASKVMGAGPMGQACRLVAQAARSGWPGTLRAAVNVFLRRKDALYAWLTEHTPAALPKEVGGEGSAVCAGLVFLVVEDHEFQRGMIMRLLRQLGALEVHGFADGASALAAARDLPLPAILVLDLAMPDIHGVEVLRIAAHESLALSIIVNSASEPDMLGWSLQVARSCGAPVLGAVSKPLTAAKLAPLLAPIRHVAGDKTVNAVQVQVATKCIPVNAATTERQPPAGESHAAPGADAS